MGYCSVGRLEHLCQIKQNEYKNSLIGLESVSRLHTIGLVNQYQIVESDLGNYLQH